jgi:hypothetical protein
MERIRWAYAYFNGAKGAYNKKDLEALGFSLNGSPSETLIKSYETGQGGVCRHFTSLLNWTLNHVSRGPDGKEQFSAHVEFMPGHTMVTVTMDPKGKYNGQKFSLDPVNFDQMTPIPVPDLTAPDSAMNSQREECQKIVDCYSSERASPGNSGGALPIGTPGSR